MNGEDAGRWLRDAVLSDIPRSFSRAGMAALRTHPGARTRLASTPEHFMEYVEPEPNTGCWLWTGTLNRPGGYGRCRVNKVSLVAHRAAWVFFIGPVPDEAQVLHRCDTPSCVNPRHLFLGDATANMQDMVAKGRHRAPMPFLRGYDARRTRNPKTQCAWCWPPGSDGHDPQASHGICQRHADELRAKHGLAPARAVRGTRND